MTAHWTITPQPAHWTITPTPRRGVTRDTSTIPSDQLLPDDEQYLGEPVPRWQTT